MFNVASAKLTGAPGTSGWAQVHEFTPGDTVKLSVRGRLITVVATSHTESGIDTIAAGRELLSRFHEEYFGNLTGKPFDALNAAMRKVVNEFKNAWGDVEISAVVVLGDAAYFAACGGAGVMLSRGGALAKIIQTNNSELLSASGYPKEGDVILLATKAFFDKVPQGVIKASLSSPTPSDAIEILAPIVHGSDSPGSLGTAILKFAKSVPVPGLEAKPVIGYKKEVSIKTKPFKDAVLFLRKIAQRIPKKNIYIKPPLTDEVSPQSKRLTFSIAIILLFLLAVSIGFGIRQKKLNDFKNKYQGILEQAGSEIDQAISLASVSPDKSRELFADSQQKLTEIDALGVKDAKLDALRQKINDSRAAILGEYLVVPEMFLDLTLLSSGFKGDALAYSSGQLVVLDKTGNRVVGVDIQTKKSKVVAGPGIINSATALASYDDRVFVLESDGVYEVTNGNNKVINKTWSGEALIAAFAGNIYLMDKDSGGIYRFQGQNNTFAEKQNWLSAGTNVNFADVSQITIDGSIYALYPNARILKFSRGSPLNFNVTGTIPEIGNIDAVYANPDNEFIYLLDKAGKRVVVTDKKGAYTAQYVDDQISNAINIIASEVDKKLIILTGDKLYSIELKHL